MNQVYYTPWLDEHGKMIDDGTVTRLTRRLPVTAAHPCYRWFMLNAAGLDAQVEDITETTAALALQGRSRAPCSRPRPARTGRDVPYFGRRATRDRAASTVDVTRTGYTGDLGYELWVATDDALAMWDRLFEVGPDYGLRPAGINALDVVARRGRSHPRSRPSTPAR